MRRHFAHAQGQADPDCEHYFPSVIALTGRRMPTNREAAEGDESSRSMVYFSMGPAGPTIYLNLPPSPPNDDWKGFVDVTAHRIERRLLKRHLDKGSSIPFPLSDGQWFISVSDSVSPEYVSRIAVGPGSLESRLNLFDATRMVGRQIGPSQPLRLGDAVWIVTRDPTFAGLCPPSISIGDQHRAAGWEILYLQLPDEVSSDVASETSRWLQRPIRNRHARLWIETPWPIAVGDDGVPILPRLDAGVTLQSDQSLDIEIRSQDGQLAHSVEQSKELHWRNPTQGLWNIFVNGKRFGQFETTDKQIESVPALHIVTENGSTFDLFHFQSLIDRHADVWEDSARLRLAWSDASVGRLTRINSTPIPDSNILGSIEIIKGEPISIRSGNLGSLNWQAESTRVEKSTSEQPSADLLDRAQWLTGMMHLFRTMTPAAGIRLTFKTTVTHPAIGQLQGTFWPLWLQPQIETFRALVEATS